MLEVKDVEIYTYLRLKTSTGETWAAVSKAPVKKGDKVTLNNVSTMENFESQSSKRPSRSFCLAAWRVPGRPQPTRMQELPRRPT